MSLISAYLTASITLMYVKFMRGDSISLHDLWAINFNKFIHYILSVLISSIVMMFGFIFFIYLYAIDLMYIQPAFIGCIAWIYPSLNLMARLMFVQYLVLDKELSFLEAIKTSFKISDGHVLDLISFIFAMFFIIVLGFLSLFIGVVVALPVSSLAAAQLYILFSNKNSLL